LDLFTGQNISLLTNDSGYITSYVDTNIFVSGVSDCGAGEYVYGFNSDGTIDCRAETGGGGTDTTLDTNSTASENWLSTQHYWNSDQNVNNLDTNKLSITHILTIDRNATDVIIIG